MYNITLIMQTDFHSCDFNEPTQVLPALEKLCIKSQTHFDDVEQIWDCIYLDLMKLIVPCWIIGLILCTSCMHTAAFVVFNKRIFTTLYPDYFWTSFHSV